MRLVTQRSINFIWVCTRIYRLKLAQVCSYRLYQKLDTLLLSVLVIIHIPVYHDVDNYITQSIEIFPIAPPQIRLFAY